MTVEVPLSMRKLSTVYMKKLFGLEPDLNSDEAVDEVLNALIQFRTSSEKYERVLFECIVDDIFNESKFFPSFPFDVFSNFARLFSGMIELNLLSDDNELSVAHYFILDALTEAIESKMYFFGILTLDFMKHDLINQPEFSYLITKMPNFPCFPSILSQCVISALPKKKKVSFREPEISDVFEATPWPEETPVDRNEPADGVERSPLIANTRNRVEDQQVVKLKPVEDDDNVMIPPSDVQKQVGYICNTLSSRNIEQKCQEVKAIVDKNYRPWFARYLVTKRISNEFELHALFDEFLKGFDNKMLNNLVEAETVRNIKILLKKDKKLTTPNHKMLLKNLGHWLGMITLAKDRPVVFDVQNLMDEACDKGEEELAFTLPFVVKILESCSGSKKKKVFGPRTPWTTAVLDCLARLYKKPEIKINMKCEIELLYKKLGLKLSRVPYYTYNLYDSGCFGAYNLKFDFFSFNFELKVLRNRGLTIPKKILKCLVKK